MHSGLLAIYCNVIAPLLAMYNNIITVIGNVLQCYHRCWQYHGQCIVGLLVIYCNVITPSAMYCKLYCKGGDGTAQGGNFPRSPRRPLNPCNNKFAQTFEILNLLFSSVQSFVGSILPNSHLNNILAQSLKLSVFIDFLHCATTQD